MDAILKRLTRAEFDGHVISVLPQSDWRLRVEITASLCDTPADRRFVFEFLGVDESTVVPGELGEVSAPTNHPLLLESAERNEGLYFSSAPASPHEVIGRLYEAHVEVFGDWRPLSRYVTASAHVLAGGTGQLARGPVSLIARYEAALVGRLDTYRVVGVEPRAARQVFFFDDSYVLATGVHLAEVV